MKQLSRKMMKLLSVIVMGFAVLNFNTCSWWDYHQPKVPENLKID